MNRDHGDSPFLDRIFRRIVGENYQSVFDERTLDDQALVNVVAGKDLSEPKVLADRYR